MPARGGILIWTMLAVLAGGLTVYGAPAGLTHEASGLRFPDSIEGKWQRHSQSLSGKNATVEYRSRAGWQVNITVKPAAEGARGPSKLDGDSSSDATPVFRQELEASVQNLSNGLANARTVSSQRFRVAPQQKGLVGMKVVVNGRLNDQPTNREVLLLERNGFFVAFTVEYPEKQWSGAGLAYTDVAHFVGWPSSSAVQTSQKQ